MISDSLFRLQHACRKSSGLRLTSQVDRQSICSAADAVVYKWSPPSGVAIPDNMVSRKNLFLKPPLALQPGQGYTFTLEAWYKGGYCLLD